VWLNCFEHQRRVSFGLVRKVTLVVLLRLNDRQLSSDLRKQVFLAPNEKFMLKTLLVLFVSGLVEVVHV